MAHPFDTAIRLTPSGEHSFIGHTSPNHANMVGPFGGLTCAVFLHAALLHPQRQGDPLSLTVNFAAPIADGAFTIDARPLRTNRSTQHWNLLLSQGDGVCASASAVFAQRRQTWAAQETMPPGDTPPAQDLPRAQTQGHPAFASCYDMRFPSADMEDIFSAREQTHSHSRVWLRDHPPRPLDFPALAAICDLFYPRIFVRRRRRLSIGTVTVTTYFHADAQALVRQADRHVLGAARASRFLNGYFDQHAEIWSDDGHLLASTHQMVYFRD